MRLIADGVVDREGVDGLARRVGYTPRHLARHPHRRARRRTARAGPGPTGPDRARADRDDRADLRRHRVRLGLLEHPAVQRHDPRGVRRDARPQLRGGRGGRAATGTVTMRLAVRTPFAGRGAARVPRRPRRAGRRGGRDGWYARTLALPHGTGTVRLEVAGRGRARADGLRHRDVHARGPARHRRRDRAGPPAAGRRLRPGRGGRRVRRRPGDRSAGPRAARACGCPGTSTAHELAVRAVLGQQVSVAGAGTVAGRTRRRARPAARRARRRAHPPVPGRRDARRARPRGRCRCRGPAAGRWSRCAPRWRPATSPSTADRTATTSAGRCWRCPASGRGRPTTSRCARSAHPDVFLPTDLGIRDALAGLGRRPRERRAAGRGLGALALLRPAAPLADPDAPQRGEVTCGP